MRARAWLLPMLLATPSCDTIVGNDPPATNEVIFDLVWEDLDRHYSSFPVKGIDWTALRTQYRGDALAAPTSDSLAAVVGNMLAELEDVHVTLYTPARAYRYDGYLTRPYYFDMRLIFSNVYIAQKRITTSGRIQYGRLGTLLYAWIPSLGGDGWSREMGQALRAFTGITGVILDIRDNGGGDNGTGREIAGHFADQRRLFAHSRFRNGPDHDDLTNFAEVYLEPFGDTRFMGPVVVLTSLRNFSAAEDLVQAMRVLPNVTIVGDTTGGGSSNPLHRELPNGWTYRFSEGLLYDENRQLLEIVGIPPDVFIRETDADATAGRDAVLERGCAALGLPRCGRP